MSFICINYDPQKAIQLIPYLPNEAILYCDRENLTVIPFGGHTLINNIIFKKKLEWKYKDNFIIL